MDAWLRSLLFHTMAKKMNAGSLDRFEEEVAEQLDDTVAARAFVETKWGETALFKDLDEDLKHFIVLHSCVKTPGDHSTQEVHGAIKHLKELRMTPLRESFDESDVGKGVLAAANESLQASAKDSCGDEKFEMTVEILNTPGLPNATVDEGDAEIVVVENFAMLSDMVVTEVLSEGLENCTEAIQLWSNPGLDRKAEDLKLWLHDFFAELRFYDACLCAFVQYLPFNLVASSASTEDDNMELLFSPTDEDAEEALGGIALMRDRLERREIDEQPWQEFLADVERFLDFLPEKIKRAEEVRDMKNKSLPGLRANMKARASVTRFLKVLGNFTERTQGNREILEDWKRKGGPQKDNDSFLGFGIDLLKAMDELKGAEITLELYRDSKMLIKFGEGENQPDETDCESEFLCDLVVAQRLPQDLLNLLFPRRVVAQVCGCLQDVFDSFVNDLNFDAVKTKDVPPPVNTALSALAPNLAS